MSNLYNEEYLIAEDEGTAFFFVSQLTRNILDKIKAIVQKYHFKNFIIQGFVNATTDESHFVKIDKK